MSTMYSSFKNINMNPTLNCLNKTENFIKKKYKI